MSADTFIQKLGTVKRLCVLIVSMVKPALDKIVVLHIRHRESYVLMAATAATLTALLQRTQSEGQHASTPATVRMSNAIFYIHGAGSESTARLGNCASTVTVPRSILRGQKYAGME